MINAQASNNSSLKILVIDDDPAIQLLLKRTLTQQGYQVTIASDGKEGLAKAKEITPAMVICDWLMPKMNGLEVCRQVKSLPELSTTFFVLLTSLGSVEDKVKGLDAGSDDFLCKPIEMYELNARVRAGLRLHQLSRDLQKQKQLLEAELAEAADYVSSILPQPLNELATSIDVRFIPSRQLGGDSFDYYWLDREHLVIYLLDVSGHGLRAALPSLSVINLLRSRGLPQVDYHKPSDVLKGLNNAFPMNERNDKYFTIWYGVYNPKKRRLTYASAGHPPAILFSPQNNKLEVIKLKTPGFPIGMFSDAIYQDNYSQISSQDCLYIFSDGIYEVEQENGELLGIEHLVDLLKLKQLGTITSLDQVIEKVLSCNSKQHLDDDLSIMEIDFH